MASQNQRGWSTLTYMEKIMSKPNDTSKLSRELTEAELNAVAGGFRITNLRGNANTVPVPPPQAPQILAL
jgi:hypothetical protein